MIIVTPYLVRPVSRPDRACRPTAIARRPTSSACLGRPELQRPARAVPAGSPRSSGPRSAAASAAPAPAAGRRASPGVQAVIRRLHQEGCRRCASQVSHFVARSPSALGRLQPYGRRRRPTRGVAAVNVAGRRARRLCVRRCRLRADRCRRPSSGRLDGWFAALGLGYGDRIYVDGALRRRGAATTSPGSRPTTACCSATARRSPPAPSSPGTVRVVVSRTARERPGLPELERPVAAQLRQPDDAELRLRGELATSPRWSPIPRTWSTAARAAASAMRTTATKAIGVYRKAAADRRQGPAGHQHQEGGN